jgi:hypothetical protein
VPTWTREELEAAADRGAAWLDEHRSGWWQEPSQVDEGIDLELLDMGGSCQCVGGQLEGTFPNFQDEYRLDSVAVVRLGFMLKPTPPLPVVTDAELTVWEDEVDAGYAVLTDRWRHLISTRRTAAKEGAR